MKVIETLVRGKYSDQSLCEDGIVVGTRIAAVIDGVTSHGKLHWNGGTSGHFAKDVLCEYIRMHEEELAQLQAAECMRRLNNALGEKSDALHPGPKDIAEYPRACIILYNSEKREVWSYGDCQCSIGDELHSEGKEVDRLLSELRSFVIRSEIREKIEQEFGRSAEKVPPHACDQYIKKVLAQITQHDIGRETILPLIEKQLWFENTPGPFGYPVLNGVSFSEDMVKVWPVPDGTEVILATDGYPLLRTILAESEEKLRDIIEEDPLCFGVNAGTKGIMEGMESYDDRAYVRVV